jgi:hypothetical protein
MLLDTEDWNVYRLTRTHDGVVLKYAVLPAALQQLTSDQENRLRAMVRKYKPIDVCLWEELGDLDEVRRPGKQASGSGRISPDREDSQGPDRSSLANVQFREREILDVADRMHFPPFRHLGHRHYRVDFRRPLGEPARQLWRST